MMTLPEKLVSSSLSGEEDEKSEERIHISFLAGIRIIQRGRDPEKYSGYQVRQSSRQKNH
jgi:hypothetical protein